MELPLERAPSAEVVTEESPALEAVPEL